MLMRRGAPRDPFWDDGIGAKRTRLRRRLLSSTAFAVSVVACGLTAAAWMRVLAPLFSSLGVPGLP